MAEFARAGQRSLRVGHSHPIWLPVTQNWLYHLVRSTPEQIENHVFCERQANRGLFALPNVHELHATAPATFLVGRVLRRVGVRHHMVGMVRGGRRFGIRVWHSHFGHIAWADREIARILGVPHVATFYGNDVNKLPTTEPRWRHRYRALFASVDRVLCEGPHMARCIERLGCPPDKLRVQHLGIPLESIPFIPREWQRGTPLRVLVAASFREKKGIPDAVRAVGILARRRPVELTILGDAGSDPAERREKARIVAAVEEFGLGPFTRMLGYQPPATLMEEAYRHHVFLSPSRTASDGDTEGGAPVAIIEMAASGMPVVATTHCDIPEVLDHGCSGLLAPEGDVEMLATLLQKLADEPHAWPGMIHAARDRIEREFDLATQGRRLASLYEELFA